MAVANKPLQNRMPKARARLQNQAARIEQGIKSGQLTKEEAQDLRASGKDVREAIRSAKADGVVTPEERKAVQELLDARSSDIFEAKHNDTTRFSKFCGG